MSLELELDIHSFLFFLNYPLPALVHPVQSDIIRIFISCLCNLVDKKSAPNLTPVTKYDSVPGADR